MPEHDAFGREVGEDPLADLGWGTSNGASGTAPAPVAAETAQSAPATSSSMIPPSMSAPTPPPSRVVPTTLPVPGANVRSIARLIRGAIALFIVGSILAGGLAVFNAGSDAVEDIRNAVPAFPVTPGGGGGGADAPSLLQPAAFKRAVRILGRETPGKIQTLRLDAGRISLTGFTPDGKHQVVTFEAGAEAPTVVSTSAGGNAAAGTFTYEDLRPEAMARALKGAGKRTGLGRRDVDYLTFSSFGGQRLWGVYYRSGKIVQADARGRVLRQVG